MKYLLIMALFLKATSSFGQNKAFSGTIGQPVYDTTNIDLKSTNSFYFCSNLYKIPRDCDYSGQSNCCSFSAHTRPEDKSPQNGVLNCYDGTALIWHYCDSLEMAQNDFNDYLRQMKNQMKNVQHKQLKIFVCNKEVVAYKVQLTSLQNRENYEIKFYGAINGKFVQGELVSQKELQSSSELSAFYQQIFKF